MSVIIFTIEIVAASIGKEDYFGSFFMGVDVVATFSLIFDIGPVALYIATSGQNDGAADAASMGELDML